MDRVYLELGKTLIAKHRAGQLTQGVGSKLVQEALGELSQEWERQRLDKLLRKMGPQLTQLLLKHSGGSLLPVVRWLEWQVQQLKHTPETFQEGGGI